MSFLSARDFEIGRAFYLALGFPLLLDVAIFAMRHRSPIPQQYFQKE